MEHSYVTGDANCTAGCAQLEVAGGAGGYFPLRLSRTDGRPQSRWRDRLMESRLTDIQASLLAVRSPQFSRDQLPSCSHTMLVPRSWNTVLMAFGGMQCTRSIRSANIVFAQLAKTSVLCLSTDSRLFIVTPSTLSHSTLVNPGTAGGGFTTERRDFVLRTSSADFDRLPSYCLSPILLCGQLQADKT